MSTNDEGLELWFAWKRAHEQVRCAVLADVTAGTDVSEAELTVLICLADAGGTMRQSAMLSATGWDKTRLSHLLTRMETRQYLRRDKVRQGVEVVMAPGGQRARDAARPRLIKAVDTHLRDRLASEDLVLFQRVLGALSGST